MHRHDNIIHRVLATDSLRWMTIIPDGQDVIVDADGAAWAPDRSHLVGSTASMARIRAVLQEGVGLSSDEIEQVTAVNPARAIGARETR